IVEVGPALLERVILREGATARQPAAQRRHLLDAPAEVELRAQQLVARLSVLLALAREALRVDGRHAASHRAQRDAPQARRPCTAPTDTVFVYKRANADAYEARALRRAGRRRRDFRHRRRLPSADELSGSDVRHPR